MAKRKVSVFEIVWYTLCGLVALWGLTYITLGLIGKYASLPVKDNVLLNASKDFAKVFGLGFFEWGLIILAISAVAAIIVLCTTAKKFDREYEKQLRRQARRQGFTEVPAENAEIIDAE